ncbi:PAS domain-containing protein, partial [Elusimicrobiota bacterium]
MTPDLKEQIQEMLFDQAPLRIAVIDRDLNIVEANKFFEEAYGDWKGRKCHRVYKGREERCPECPAALTFGDGKVRLSDEQTSDDEGQARHYRIRFFPMREPKGGRIRYVVEMSSDITDNIAMEKEHSFLFDNVPCYITVINRGLKIVKSNSAFDAKFGREGKEYCYELYKGTDKPCRDCPAMKVFESGVRSSALQVGVDRDGNESHYMVTITPLKYDIDGVSEVMKIAQDVSELLGLKARLKKVEAEKQEA